MSYKLLAIDTASEGCSASLYIDGQWQSEFSDKPQAHSELILPMCDALLASAGLVPQQLDGVAFSRGPGSFTGVRIGAGVTQGIAFAADIPVVPVSTLASLAYRTYRLHGHTHVLAALDARMQEVYWGAYTLAEGEAVLQGEELVCSPDQTPLPQPANWVSAGKGWLEYEQALTKRFSDVELSATYADIIPHAEDVALLALKALDNKQTCSPEQALPIYLRDKIADKRR